MAPDAQSVLKQNEVRPQPGDVNPHLEQRMVESCARQKLYGVKYRPVSAIGPQKSQQAYPLHSTFFVYYNDWPYTLKSYN